MYSLRRTILTAAMVFISASVLAYQVPKRSLEARIHSADTRIEDVLAHPGLYDGKRLTFDAWVSLRDEDQNLWVTWNDHEHWETRKCISLTNYDVLSGKATILDGRHVKVTGIVRIDASERGAVIRLSACRNLALELIDATSVEIVDSTGR